MGPPGGVQSAPPVWAHGQVTPEGPNFGGCNFGNPHFGPTWGHLPIFQFWLPPGQWPTPTPTNTTLPLPNPPTARKPSHEAKARVHFCYAAVAAATAAAATAAAAVAAAAVATALHMIKQPPPTIIKPDGALPPRHPYSTLAKYLLKSRKPKCDARGLLTTNVLIYSLVWTLPSFKHILQCFSNPKFILVSLLIAFTIIIILFSPITLGGHLLVSPDLNNRSK